jgi:hypothetical protein
VPIDTKAEIEGLTKEELLIIQVLPLSVDRKIFPPRDTTKRFVPIVANPFMNGSEMPSLFKTQLLP